MTKDSTRVSSAEVAYPPLLESSDILKTRDLHEEETQCPEDRKNELYDFFCRNASGDLFKWHHYFEIYGMLFERYRTIKNLRLLEIGVSKGGSLRLWRSYFHSSATIVGVDISDSCRRLEDAAENIFVRIGDQANDVFLKELLKEFGSFDIIIDDGGHTTSQQLTSFAHLYPGLSPDGLYLVEDTHTSLWEKFQDDASGMTFLDVAKGLVNRLYDPYAELSDGFSFRVGNSQKQRTVTVTNFYIQTKGIFFFDSIVAFQKGRRFFPRAEIR